MKRTELATDGIELQKPPMNTSIRRKRNIKTQKQAKSHQYTQYAEQTIARQI
jgi:hypothetical protein